MLGNQLSTKNKISDLNDSLITYKDELEEIVRQRTEELEQAYVQLNTTNSELFSKHQELSNTISELKQTQNQLIQSEKLASLGVFTAGIAHEINNPINFITAGSNALFDIIEYLKNHPNELEEKIDDISSAKMAIETGIDKTVAVISSLRNYAHAGEEEFTTYNVSDSLNDALLLLQSTYRYHINIEKDFPKSMEIECIPGKVNQVFVNLISNAVQAIQNKGTITINGYWKEEKACFEITDNGSGIREEHIKQIFDPFFTTKDVGVGTGLGLYIVHGVVKQHHGDIQVTSKKDQGTTFRLILPKTQSGS